MAPWPTWFLALTGGAMIGAASGLVLLTHGRIAGISGIAAQAVRPAEDGRAWRLAFLAGMVAAGAVARAAAPAAIGGAVRSLPVMILAGLAVGYGAQLGSGCTSGHGVCGLSRWSPRALVAVAVFMTTGAVTVALARVWS